MFLQFLKKGLAYKAKSEINWCPKDKCGLANEEVIDGKCERCGTVTVKKEKEQWMLGITKYAERLDKDLDLVDYPERVKSSQRNWIGKSTGSEISFPIKKNYNYLILHAYKSGPNDTFYPWLKNELEKKGSNVQSPHLPDPAEEKWVDIVLSQCKIDENTVIIGHSLGSAVAMKVIEKLNHKIAGLVMAGGFAVPKFKDKHRSLEKTFNWNFDFEKIKKDVGFIKIISAINDYAVPLLQGKLLHQKLGGELFEVNAAESHFCGKQEPTILDTVIDKIKVFTTRIDTIFSGTFIVLAPEHPLVKSFLNQIPNRIEVEKYINEVKNKPDIDRTLSENKTGVCLEGMYAINPATLDKMPIWVSDFVLGHYGTGAVFADAHDKRDFDMAKKYNIPLKTSVRTKDDILFEKIKNLEECFEDEGILFNSKQFDGLTSAEARPKIIDWLETKGSAKKRISFKLRDWVFSRQRYWGEPIPVVNCENCGLVPVKEKDLPVKLPPVKSYKPTDSGESPLAGILKWVNTKCPKCGGKAKRETDTMPNWAGSSWYYLRYTDSKNKKEFASKKNLKYWTPVDWYNGGMEHTTLHLLYSRFWHKFLFDLKLVPTVEPYKKRTSHGMILGEGGVKMSKSLGNVVNPDEIVKTYGADTLRVYEMFIGPFEDTAVWNTESIIGSRRFIEKVWRIGEKVLKQKNSSGLTLLRVPGGTHTVSNSSVVKILNKTIKKVGEDIEAMRFNTAISAMMILATEMEKTEFVDKDDFKKFLKILAPFAPHIAEDIWHSLGEKKSINISIWPKYDEMQIIDDEVKIAVQVNGKTRAEIIITASMKEDEIKEFALKEKNVISWIENKEIKRVIYVPGRIINIVV